MTERLVEQLDLKNGLRVEIYDQSRKVAGDRWHVELAAKMDIPVPDEPVMLKNGDTVLGAELQAALGKSVQFAYKSERNFIQEKEACFEELKTSFLNNTRAYLEHADFQRSFVLKKYREYLAQQQRYR